MRELPDKWDDRASRRIDGWQEGGKTTRGYNLGYAHAENRCADELDDELPQWTKITEDESTWPKNGDSVLFIDKEFDTLMRVLNPIKDDTVFKTDHSNWLNLWWRPLCDLDTPPQEDSK